MNFQSECFCGLQVDNELEVDGLHHWQVCVPSWSIQAFLATYQNACSAAF